MTNERGKIVYEEKFKELIRLCQHAKESGVDLMVINHPEELGDNYDEIVESLNRISAAKLKLVIVPPDERAK